MSITPFLKWAGGKRWLLPFLEQVRPARIRTYFEPFVGSGAVFFAIAPKRAVLSDTNEWLITTYRAIRDNPDLVENYLKRHQSKHSADYFYRVRLARPKDDYARAANLLYLNRTCWNALFRVNRKGQFNVPKGSKDAVLLSDDDFEEWSLRLQSCKLETCDFEQTMKKARKGDFVFADPPYVTTHSMNGFIKYNEKLFTWADQERLAMAAFEAAKRGATVVISNSDHRSIISLYRSYSPQFVRLDRSSVIAASAESRRRVQELLIVLRPER